MTKQRIAVASDPNALAGAEEGLARGHAVDAVVAGVLAAAGADPGVLLGPVTLLVGGPGIGRRAIDGRVLQPGRGAPRPRGFRTEDPIPEAAYVGVPTLPAALAIALATFGAGTLSQVCAKGIEIARKIAPERADVLKEIARRGAAALVDGAVAAELAAAAGRLAGGVLTLEDFAAVRPTVAACTETRVAALSFATAPWGAERVRDAAAPAIDAGRLSIVAAADGRGRVAIACYGRADEGLEIPALGLRAPRAAAPVLRGERRVAVGEPRGCAAPIALVELASEHVHGALGVTATPDPEGELAARLAKLAEGLPIEAVVRGEAAPVATALAVLSAAAGVTAVQQSRPE